MGADSPVSSPAAVESAATDVAGADSLQSQSAAIEGDTAEGTDTTSQEGAEGVTEGDKKPHNKTLEERAAEIAERKVQERFTELERQLQEQRRAQTPDYSPPEVEAQVERNIFAHETRLRDIEEQFRLDPQNLDPSLVQEHRQIKRWVAEAEQALAENQRKRQAAEAEAQHRARNDQIIASINSDIANASPLVREGLGITPEQWQAGEQWFMAQRKASPVLDAEYRERCLRDGAVRALNWAAKHVRENMGKAATTAKATREAGKEATFSGGDAGTVAGFENVRSFGDLMKLPSARINEFASKHPQRFQNLKQKHFK